MPDAAADPEQFNPDEAAAYEAALDRLFARTGGAWRLGLERVSQLLQALGDPQRQYPVFHVAGTNGKGSTVATLDALLRHAGMRVGKYTSPHLVHFNERVLVNGQPMPRARIARWLVEYEPMLTEIGATFFEATTAMALSWFADERVDVALIEVGLGGRLDATNIVTPVAAAVTSVGYDHMEYLGNDLASIAAEKAGIYKPGVPAIVGETQPEVQAILIAHAERAGASPVLATGRDWTVRDIIPSVGGTRFTLDRGLERRRLRTPLIGTCQAHNAAVALAMLDAAGGPWQAIARQPQAGLSAVQLAGRFHVAGRWLFDVAHNAEGAETVVANLLATRLPHPVVAIVTVLQDKDWQGILRALATVSDRILLTHAPTAPVARAWKLDEVEEWVKGEGIRAERIDDFDTALNRADDIGATILVTGSFHTVGDAMERLQVDPLAR